MTTCADAIAPKRISVPSLGNAATAFGAEPRVERLCARVAGRRIERVIIDLLAVSCIR